MSFFGKGCILVKKKTCYIKDRQALKGSWIPLI